LHKLIIKTGAVALSSTARPCALWYVRFAGLAETAAWKRFAGRGKELTDADLTETCLPP